jgi:hypothetical protein
MTITATAYKTSPCKDYLMKRTETEVLGALIRNSLLRLRDNVWAIPPEAYDPGVAMIPVFNYPLILEHRNEKHSVVDLRSLLVYEDGNMRPRKYDELTARVLQAQLALEWANGSYARLFNFNQMPLAVFAGWLGEVIAKRFYLNPESQLHVSILAAIYYYNMFEENGVDGHKGAEMVAVISRACGYRPGDIENVVKAYPNLDSIADFCQACKDFTQDVHLQDLNTLTLTGVVGGYWYGNAGRETIAVALEYPPVWLALIFQALTDRSFKKAGLTTVVERRSYARHHENFVRGMLLYSELQDSIIR